MNSDISSVCTSQDSTLHEVMALIDREGLGIALIVDSEGVFLRTVTDGDIRRAILNGSDLESVAFELLKSESPSITASITTTPEDQQEIMLEHEIRHLPLLAPDGRVVELARAEDLLSQQLPVQAVIMAGGFGTRLRPLTDNTPKPMLHIGGKPLMQRTIENFQKAGINRINVTTHYLPEKITGHFGNGRDFGVDINYVAEDQPLGTAGALRLMSEVEEPLLVINGDILTDVDFRSLSKFHQEHNAALTVAVRQYDVEVPYGVVEADGGRVRGLKEKPRFDFLVNAGIYLLEPAMRKYIPSDRKYDMTDLIEAMIDSGENVMGFPITEYWLDIGKHDDFQQAQHDVTQRRWAA